MSVCFVITGEEFDPEQFLEASGLIHHTLRISRRGEPIRGFPGRLKKASQIRLNPSDADFDHFQDQVADVISFLKSNANKLNHLLASTHDYSAYFDFPINDRYNVAQADYLEPELLRLSGNLNIGIMISRYPNFKEQQ